MGFVAFAAMSCLVWGVPASAQASSAPVIESQSVSNLAPTDATLEAKINTEGLETTYDFYLQERAPCLEVSLPCEVPEYEPLALPSGKLLGSFVSQSVSVDVNSASVTLCPFGDSYWVTATNSAGTTIGQRQRMFTVDTLVAVKCTPLRLQLNTTGPSQNAGQGSVTPGASDSGGDAASSPKTRALTDSRELTKALRACNRKPRKRRASCVRQAHKKYGTTGTKTKKS
jgi:hypothetical protein